MRSITLRRAVTALTLLLSAGATRQAAAQTGNGYRFGPPEATLTLRGGYAVPSASSDLFSFTTQQLTLNKRDFNGLTIGAEFGVPVADRWELSADVSYIRAHKGSSFRHYIDNNDAEIEQTTTFERVPLMANLKFLLASPGRSIGKLAWIPSHVVPYIGAGAGAVYYRFKQNGDFVDYQTFRVFSDDLNSDAWAAAGQLLGGFDVSLTPTLAITTDARYIWAKGTLGQDFSGFNKIDLSGASATVGLTIRM